MVVYLLKVIACSGLFYALYALLFRNEKMLVFNRFYLLLSLVVSFFIPLITFTVIVPAAQQPLVYDTYVYDPVVVPADPATGFNDYLLYAAIVVFSMVTALLLLRFVRNLVNINRLVHKNERVRIPGARMVLLTGDIVPYSFLNHIFLNKKEYEEGAIEPEVLEHEMAHLRQKHSWDILLIELLQVFCWFNPLIYLYRRSIKINHELLADAAVVKKLGDMRSYQMILLHRAVAQSSLALISSFNYVTIKKRLVMLRKKANPVVIGLKATMVLPLAALLIFLFSESIYAQGTPKPDKMITQSGTENTIKGASPSEMKEYQKIIDSYRTVNGKTVTLRTVSDRDRDRLEVIYKKMNIAQQDQQTMGFVKPAKPFEKNRPSAADYEKWKNSKLYGVWIDEKRVSNSALNNYSNTDFALASVSRLAKNAINYGKHYVQVNLMTNAAYDVYYKNAMANKDKLMLVIKSAKPLAKKAPDTLSSKTIYEFKDGPGATENELKTYETLLSKLGRMRAGTADYKKLTQRVRTIYGKMTNDQKKSVRPLEPLPPPVAATAAPSHKGYDPGATAAEMNEYISLMKKSERNRNGRKVYLAKDAKEQARLRQLLSKMDATQLKSVSSFPPPPPPVSSRAGSSMTVFDIQSQAGDTLHFGTGNEAAEKLLKEVPGLVTDSEGNMIFSGRHVKDLLVDGRPFVPGKTVVDRKLPGSRTEVKIITE